MKEILQILMIVTAFLIFTIGISELAYSQSPSLSGLNLSAKINKLYEFNNSNVVSVEIDIVNNGNTPLGLYPFELLLVDSKAREFSQTSSYQLQSQGYPISDEDCNNEFVINVNPGLSQTLNFCYLIPKDTGTQFSIKEYQYDPDMCHTYPNMCETKIFPVGASANVPNTKSTPNVPNTQSTPNASIKISTDKSSYNYGDTVTISGNVQPVISGTPLSVIIRDPRSNIAYISSVNANSDGTFLTKISTTGNPWNQIGIYQVYVQYGSASVNAQTSFNFNLLSTQQSTTSIPNLPSQSHMYETNQSSTSQIPMKTYENKEYNFTIQYPSDWLVEENYVSGNGNIGIVKFKSDPSEVASLSVWGKMEITQQSAGNQYLNKVLQDAQNFCSSFTFETDKYTCTFQLEKSWITQTTNGLTHYIIMGNQYWVAAPNSTGSNYAQFYIEDDISKGNDIWKLYGYATVTSSSDIAKATAYSYEIAQSLGSFTILGTSQSIPSVASLTVNQPVISIPSWIHNTAKWWSEGSVGDNDFVQGVQYLIQQKVIVIPKTTLSSSQHTNQIPPWVKGVAGWWASGKISDDEFVKGIQYLVQQGIIKVS